MSGNQELDILNRLHHPDAPQMFILEDSGLLEVLPELGCSFPLTLTIKHGCTKRHPKESPAF